MDKELKETKRMVSEQIDTINKKLEIIKRNQIEILDLKTTIPEMKNWLEGFSDIFEQVEEPVNERKLIEIIQPEG